tara:strand:+ start:7242 stop:8147 length:906 start_codon:yes stop_codon:yes gene_type:complete
MTILKTILYFSIFKHPLNKLELLKFSIISSEDALNEQLSLLLQKGTIFKIGDFYTDHNDSSIIERRLIGNQRAKEIMPKAVKVSRRIAKFPYVECVCLSGALSKGYYDDNGDFDFFIITKPNRLWIARTLLVFYKKVFLLNSKKYFCVNYFISSDNLEIPEQNLFTATEIVTLIPLYGRDTFKAFLDANTWVLPYFPNKPITQTNTTRDTKKNAVSQLIQKLLNGNFGLLVDKKLQKITLKKWVKKFKHLADEDFNIAMKSTRQASKHHPQNYQNKVTKRLHERYTEVIKQFNLKSHEEHA